MKIAKTKVFTDGYQKLPLNIQRKTDKQIIFLATDIRYPSLRCKKIQGQENVWEARIDRSYRFIFVIETDTVILLRAGPHDEGLGKK